VARVQTVNPATEQVLETYDFQSNSELDAKLGQAQEGFHVWRRLSHKERGEFLILLARELRAEKEKLAVQASVEMGKPVTEARAEVEKCAGACEYHAEAAGRWLADDPRASSPRAFVSYQPMGPILGIMPWNFPYWQVVRFAAPTLMAGNVVLIKHAPNTWGCAGLLADCFWKAGFAKGVYQDLRADIPQLEGIITDVRVAGVSLTGSTRAGRSVAAAAGGALKKVVLELGGSDPYILLDDADVALAAEWAVQARMQNAGQSCIAGKRFIVTRKNYSDFHDRVRELLSKYEFGDPTQAATRLGPLARRDLRDHLHDQVRRSIREGARCEMGGELPPGPGYFYPPTLLTGLNSESLAQTEEFFGPVASLFEAADEAEAFSIANASPFGLGAAVFSRDEERAVKLARDELVAGMCFVNGMVRSDARWPFGGVKASGMGRELTEFGTREFVNIKAVVIDPSI
jgi:succinate-semialdehyde dehydrogenase/glutarate-semialdehyde dehydrogenase